MMGYSTEDREGSVSTREYIRECVDVEKFLGFCRQCGNYGKIWACPPLAFDPMEIWTRYRTLHLYARLLRPEGNMTMEQLLEAFRREKISLSRQVLEMEQQIPGSLSLAASTCIRCSPCLRAEGKPCCHPEQLRYSIEALGGDVGKTMERYLHISLQWAEQGKLPEYLTVAAGLLTMN